MSVDVAVSASADDAEESAAGVISTSGNDLELVQDATTQTVAVRIARLNVPVGSTITAAWLQFETDEKKVAPAALTIQGIAADSTPTFTSKVPFGISSRPRTTAAVAWSPPPWPVLQERGPNQRTPDLSAVVAEIISRPRWASGNPVAFVITGTGVRTAESFNSGLPPVLHLEFVPPATANTAPTVNAGPDQTVLTSALASIRATIGDDGLPVPPGTTTVAWTATGPGAMTFANASAAATTVGFETEGTYTLRATVSDGELTSFDEMNVTVAVSVVPGDGWLIRSVDKGHSTWTGSAPDDPIVFPGQPGAAHLHDFLCNQATNASSTYESMIAAPSVCPSGDTAGYWAPALFRNGVKIDPGGGSAKQQLYYRRNNLAPGTKVVPFPPDFRMVIGHSKATTLAEANAAGARLGTEQYWGCSDNSELAKSAVPVDCRTGIISLHIGFPNCWNGVKVPGDQIAAGTMQYPSNGVCPPGYPVVLPRLLERFEYPVGPTSDGITLSSGTVFSVHADFWNTWNQAQLALLVEVCLNGTTVVCGTNPTVGTNQPPKVNAGPDLTVTTTGSAVLRGVVTDDGLPQLTLTTTWSKLSGPGDVTFADPTAPATTAMFSAAGAYVLRLSSTDGALSAADDVAVMVNEPGVINVAVRQRSDDAEELLVTGAVDLNSSDLELIKDSGDQLVGLRFTDVQIPAGSQITAAWVQFETDELKSAPASLVVQAEASDNAATFTVTPFNLSSRPRTSASATWAPPAWTVLQERGAGQRTPDLAVVVQEVVSRAGWASGQSVAILVSGTGVRTAEAFDGTAAPILHVEFSPPPA